MRFDNKVYGIKMENLETVDEPKVKVTIYYRKNNKIYQI